MENVTCFSTARGPPFEVVCVCVVVSLSWCVLVLVGRSEEAIPGHAML